MLSEYIADDIFSESGTGSAFPVLSSKAADVSATIGTGSAFPVLLSKATDVFATIGTGSAFSILSEYIAVDVFSGSGTGSACCRMITFYSKEVLYLRRYAYLKNPIQCNKKDFIYKIMLYKIKENEIFLFKYCSKDAVIGSFDDYYNDLNDLYNDWNDEIDEKGWIDIEDPLPYCQHDAFLPVRVKGRDTGKPQWGKLEILKDGKWVDYEP